MDHWLDYSGTSVCVRWYPLLVYRYLVALSLWGGVCALCDSWHIVRWTLVWGCVYAYASPLCTAL